MGKKEPRRIGADRAALWGVVIMLLVCALAVAGVAWHANSVQISEESTLDFIQSGPIADENGMGSIEGSRGQDRATSGGMGMEARGERKPAGASKMAGDGPFPELARRINRERVLEDFVRVFPPTIKSFTHYHGEVTTYSAPWRRGPLTAAQAGWVKGHAGIIAEVRRFAEGPEPASGWEPKATREDKAKQEWSERRGDFYDGLCALLAAEGWLWLHEGRIEGTRDYQALIRLGIKFDGGGERGSGSHGKEVGWAAELMREWLEDPKGPRGPLEGVIAAQGELYQALFEGKTLRRRVEGIFKEDYRRYRSELIRSFNSNGWDSEVFGFYGLKDPARHWYGVGGVNAKFYIPRVDSMLEDIMVAMRNKMQAPEVIRKADEDFTKTLEWAGMNYAALRGEYLLKNYDLLAHSGSSHAYRANLAAGRYWFLRYLYDRRTRMNLTRAAMEYLRDAKTAETARTKTGRELESPWRDPMTGEAFAINQTTTQTLIYSPGPDGKDQRGLMEYDPTNGVDSAGDIVIRPAR